ncbi:MAG: hypothetical protein HC896_16325 [Bacteroidales bacterium]|nr:hypothetical protein [Bacteroidales bacterium]
MPSADQRALVLVGCKSPSISPSAVASPHSSLTLCIVGIDVEMALNEAEMVWSAVTL